MSGDGQHVPELERRRCPSPFARRRHQSPLSSERLPYVFKQFAAAELAGGKLVTVLDRHCPPGESFHLYYPNRAQTPGKLRAFIEFVRAVNWEVPA